MTKKSYTLKIRGGAEVDSYGKKAGKGALIQEEKSATLGVSQDQILFQAVKSIGFMRGLGGAQTMNEKMPTLQAANGMSGNNKPCVAYGVTTKGNGDAFVSEERHTSLSTGGGEAGQGYPCVMTAVGVDMYNQSITGDVAKTLNSIKSDSDHTPCVVTFEPGIASRVGGHVYEGVSGTIRATPGDNQMTVAYDIGEARLRTPQEYIEKSPTITARCGTGGNNVPAVVFENHAQDSRYKGPLEVAQPVTALYGTGGNNQPLVVLMDAYQHHGWRENEVCGTLTAGNADKVRGDTPLVVFSKIRRAKAADDFETWGETGVCNTLNTFDNSDVRTNECVICLQGNGIDRADTAGCNGRGWTENVSYTLNTIDRPAVVYSFDSLSSNSMKSSNPNSGCREVEVAKCLDTTIPDPSKNQGGIAIVYPKVAGTLDASYYKGCGERQGIERDVVVYPKKTGTLMANSHPGSYCGQDAYNDMFVVENRGGVRSDQP